MKAQVSDGAKVSDGHFIDRFVDNITNLDAGDTAIEGTAIGIEYVVQYGLLVLPALLICYAIFRRRIPLLVGSGAFLAFVTWYRFGTQDWEQRQNDFLGEWQIPVGDWTEQVTRWVDLNLPATLSVIEWPFSSLLNVIVTGWLLNLSWLSVCLGVFFLGWAIRNIRVGALSFLGLTICGLLGDAYWIETARTIGLIGVAVLLCVIIGVPIGVLCGRVDAAWRAVQPILDAMQVVHTFVYMLPFIFFFGIGPVSATMVTMVFALPPLIRLTNLGIRQVPEDVVEAARAYGAPEWRVLADVQLPLARPALMAGLNQTMLLSISMLGIAAIMGAGGLGRLLFQAISNLDIALAGSGGLAFFLVAVILDRLTQPETGERKNLLSRISLAWQTRRAPELFLAQQQDPGEPDSSEVNSGEEISGGDLAGAASPEKSQRALAYSPNGFIQTESFVKMAGLERRHVMLTVLGALVALFGLLLLPWAHNAGAISGYGRVSDLNLSGQSFNGIAASGGSWFGIFILLAIVLVLCSALNTMIQPGKLSRWVGPGGATAFCVAGLVLTLAYILAAPPNEAVNFSVGGGTYVALAGLILATGASIAWTRKAPLTSKIPLRPDIAFSRIAGAGVAVLFLVLAGYSGWSYDTRTESVITPELQVEIDDITARAEQAEAEGNLALGGVLANELVAKISKARRTGDIVLDGFSKDSTGLGTWALLTGLAGLLLVLPAAGVFGTDPMWLYRWNAITSGVGLGLAAIAGGWIFSLVRTADENFVSGVGVVFVLTAGGILFAVVNDRWAVFERQRQYAKLLDKTGENSASSRFASSVSEKTTQR